MFTYQSHIIYTTDAGLTWKEDLVLDESIWIIENFGDYVWIAGSNGTIMKKNFKITSVENIPTPTPYTFELFQNYPNSFNLKTRITYHLASEADVEIRIYDVIGTLIKEYKFDSQSRGDHYIDWDGTNNFDEIVTSGIYIYDFKAIPKINNKVFTSSSKMILIK